MICPKCGNQIPQWANGVCYTCARIEKEHRRFGRRRPPENPFPEPSGPGPSKRWVTKTAATTRPRKYRSNLRPLPNRHLQRAAFNRLLNDLYNYPRYLSQILKDGGLSQDQLQQLKRNHLPEFFDELVAQILAWWKKILPWQSYEILRNTYELEGLPARQTKSMMKQYRMSWSQIERYREIGLRQLRFHSRLRKLERLMVQVAQSTLKSNMTPRG
jgi:hypothetical protein